MLFGEQLAGAPETGLNLIENEHHVLAAADLANGAQVAIGRDDHAGFPLDRLDEKANGVGGDGGLQRIGVAERDGFESRRKRTKAAAGGRIGAKADDGDGPAVEVVAADDDLGLALRHAFHLVAPLPDRLDRAFHRLGAAVHGEDLVRAGQLAELLVEERELIVVERPRGERQGARLVDKRLVNLRVAVSLVDGRIGGEAIEISVAVHIPQPHALAPREHDREGRVVMGAEFSLDIEEIFQSIGRVGGLPVCTHLISSQATLTSGAQAQRRSDLQRSTPCLLKICSPNRLWTSSTISSAVRFRRSKAGFSSMMSRDPMRSES